MSTFTYHRTMSTYVVYGDYPVAANSRLINPTSASS
jgi:hypothetical protein